MAIIQRAPVAAILLLLGVTDLALVSSFLVNCERKGDSELKNHEK
jgi:hypothetical protein